jgi:indole-3-glycerol phosphate synthase
VEDLRAVKAAFADVPEDDRPPIVAKDIYIHPLQIAQAIDAGADGVLLMASLVRCEDRSYLKKSRQGPARMHP